eukprot:1156959-Pelagomonas_calceolata.AAC.5
MEDMRGWEIDDGIISMKRIRGPFPTERFPTPVDKPFPRQKKKIITEGALRPPKNDEDWRTLGHSPGLRSPKNGPQLHPGMNSRSQKYACAPERATGATQAGQVPVMGHLCGEHAKSTYSQASGNP